MKNYKITREQVLKYEMREEFPELFKTKLEVGKWYKNGDPGYEKSIARVAKLHGDNKNFAGYGVGRREIWSEHKDTKGFGSNNWIPATNEEVFEMLKNEAINRGYVGNNIRLIAGAIGDISTGKVTKHFYFNNRLMSNGYTVFDNGVWAEIIKPKQLTKKQIETKLGYQIEIID